MDTRVFLCVRDVRECDVLRSCGWVQLQSRRSWRLGGVGWFGGLVRGLESGDLGSYGRHLRDHARRPDCEALHLDRSIRENLARAADTGYSN